MKALFERRAVVQQLLTGVFFGGREGEGGEGRKVVLLYGHERQPRGGRAPPPPLSLCGQCVRYRHRHERVQARLLFGRDWITQEALLDMIDAHLDSWSWIVLDSTSSTAYISMEEQARTRGPPFFGLCSIPKLRNFVFFLACSIACTLSGGVT